MIILMTILNFLFTREVYENVFRAKITAIMTI